MGLAGNRFMLGFLIATALLLHLSVAQIGVNYGRNGNDLPSQSQAVNLFKQYNIRRIRIYDTDRATLEALTGSGIQLTVGIPNQDLRTLDAGAWVQHNIMPFYSSVNFRHIIVGNEVRPGRSDTQQYVPFVLPAMRNIYNALPPKLRASIKVTTAVDTEVIDPASNYPPENGRFRPEVALYLNPIIRFLMDTNAPLFASIYPYFAYINNIGRIDLRYALLDPNFPGVTTPSGTVYKNLFYAILDTVNAALEKSVASMSLEENTDAGRRPPPEVKGGESGWSSRRRHGGSTLAKGGYNPADDAACVANARAYVNNLIQAVKNGTPRRPGKPIETYVFAMFDENIKPGNEEERHFGLFLPTSQPKYQVNFN